MVGNGRTREEHLMQVATYASTSVAGILVGVKLVAWIMTDSIALLSGLVDSLLDAAASLINLIAVHHALQPADPEHRFGYGKAEPLAGLGQSAFIAGSALFLSIQAVNRLFKPVPVDNILIGVGVMALSLILTFVLVTFQTRIIRRTRSVAISADRLHYLGDLLGNGSILVALGGVWLTGWPFIDPLFALLIALYILHSAGRIMTRSLNLLMDREFSERDRQRIRDIVAAEGEVIDMHDLRTRSSGPRDFIQLHLELDRSLPLWRAHEVAERVGLRLRQAFPAADVIIHEDPSGIAYDRAHA
ncbi:MAG: cation efflux protein [Rhodospirillaceae bacterium]|nr:MAG: cation efflux protein [Rhodospirillaceae bacterium]